MVEHTVYILTTLADENSPLHQSIYPIPNPRSLLSGPRKCGQWFKDTYDLILVTYEHPLF